EEAGNANSNANSNIYNVNTNPPTNLNIDNSFNFNVGGNTNTNININANLKTPTPTPKPTPSPTPTPRPSPNTNSTNSANTNSTLPDNTRPSPSPSPSPTETPAVNRPVNAGVLNGRAVNLPTPAYPAAAKAMRAAGRVMVQVTLDESGNVMSAKATSGHPLLRQSAEAAARQSRFNPIRVNNQAVSATGILVYNFVN
ncbi:MAG: energy transducer TonB, partial [Pyrinomonadaceae bacterium]|nr:energy transducer TonB [Pyrinomonadaceae bacterium]